MSRNINALVDTLKDHVSAVAGADLAPVECGETFESATSDFNSAWNQAKRDGWRVKKIGTEWVHECPNCH